MTFLRVMGFSLLVVLVYASFANILPQVQSDPPAEETVATGSLDMAGMISYGEQLFTGKGTCTLCHNDRGRAPDLLKLDLGSLFPARLTDERYDGKAKGQEGAVAIEAYLHESMVSPSAYVVAGFGKKGSNDTISPMPVVNAPPIELDDIQMNAVMAFLQDRAGMEPTVPLPGADDAVAVEPDSGDGEDVEGPATDALAAIEKFYCSSCHDLGGSEADVGPPLNGIGKRLSAGEIMQAIFDPNATIAEGYEADIMPPDFGEQMYVSELTLIVDYLMSLPE
jgi:mono/diheme cytochrome c family protein